MTPSNGAGSKTFLRLHLASQTWESIADLFDVVVSCNTSMERQRQGFNALLHSCTQNQHHLLPRDPVGFGCIIESTDKEYKQYEHSNGMYDYLSD